MMMYEMDDSVLLVSERKTALRGCYVFMAVLQSLEKGRL